MLYAVKNDDDKYLFGHHQWGKPGQIVLTYSNITSAKSDAKTYGGTVVELVDKPAPVVVSEEEAEMLELAKQDSNPVSFIWGSDITIAYDHNQQNRLMRAYVNGWTVEKPKRWNVKVPHTKEAWYYQYSDTDLLTICPADKELRGKFTDAEIEHYGLQDCEKEEVTGEE